MGDIQQIKSGISIFIQRTDGRTHPAIIASVNNAAKSVTVEWFENGETKGKEIEFDTIYSLNMHLFPTAIKSTEECETKMMKLSLPATRKKPFARNTLAYSSVSENKKPVEKVKKVVSNLPIQRQQTNSRLSAPKIITSATTEAASNSLSKRSSVVKKVEKLKKNREERRFQQAKLKEEKEALINMDRGNPNWQFSTMIREYRSGLDLRPLKDSDPVDNQQITVCVRKRPLNKKENTKKEVDVITIPRRDTIVVHEPKNKVDLTKYLDNQQFRFDYAFNEDCSNEIVYKFTAKPLVQTIFDGGMATCFAYGQTGSGKTHTMGGTFSGKTQDCKKGIYAMVAVDVFKYIHSANYRSLNLVVAASFFEIYSGKVFDLLNDKAKLRVLEDSKQQVQVVGLTEKVVNSVDEVLRLIQAGNQSRTSGQTSANSNSSRSHAVFQITLRTPGSHKIHGKFSLIDLAGNERGADTSSANRLTRMEGAEINKSLLALKECIRALGRKGAHLPFRASKLTQVLRDSFIGENSKTCMIAMISPGMSSCEHSLNTLRYADRVKELAAKDPSDGTSEHSLDEDEDKSDLAALRSLNEHEISNDLYNFHEAVSELNKLEEEMLDHFKIWRDNCSKWELEEKMLLKSTYDVDYDLEAFANRLQKVISERKGYLDQLDEKVSSFRQQLVAEEEMSRKMNPPKNNIRY